MTKKAKTTITLGRNPKLWDLIAWAEQNGLRIEIDFRNREPAEPAAAPDAATLRCEVCGTEADVTDIHYYCQEHPPRG